MLTVLIDPARLASREVFDEQARQALAWVTAPPQPGAAKVLLAGEPERRARAERSQNGIPVDAQTWREILETAQSLGVDAERLSRYISA